MFLQPCQGVKMLHNWRNAEVFTFQLETPWLEIHGVQNLCQAFVHWAGLAAGPREMSFGGLKTKPYFKNSCYEKY